MKKLCDERKQRRQKKQMIKRIFTVEKIKILSYKPFWFLIAAYGGLFILASLIMSSITGAISVNNMPLHFTRLFSHPYAWNTISWIGKWFYLFLSFPVILLTINEFDYQTIRQQIVNGISRIEFVISRYVIIACLCIFASTIVLVSAVIFGKSTEDAGIFSMVSIQFLIGFFIQGMGYLGFALFVSIYLRKAVIAAGVFLIWPLLAEPIFGWIIDKWLEMSIARWLPCHVFSDVIPSPFGIITSGKALSSPDPFVLGISLVYSALMFLLVLIKIKMSDL